MSTEWDSNVPSVGRKVYTKIIFSSMSKVSIFRELSCIIVNTAVKYAPPEIFSICTRRKCIEAKIMRIANKHECDYEWVLPLSGETFSFDNYIVPSESGFGHQCTECGKEAVKKDNLRKHVENIHFPGSFTYNCKYCSQIYTTRNLLNQHMTKMHRGMSQ